MNPLALLAIALIWLIATDKPTPTDRELEEAERFEREEEDPAEEIEPVPDPVTVVGPDLDKPDVVPDTEVERELAADPLQS